MKQVCLSFLGLSEPFSGKKWLKSRWVPKELSEAQKLKRVEVATKLLQRARYSPFFDHIMTCDEKWISFVNEECHNEWRSPGQEPGQTPRKDFRSKKAMLSVWWDRRGFLQLEEQWEKVIESGGEYFDY